MKYILNHLNNTPVYIAVSFEAGGMFQPINKYGISHLTEHILANSTQNTQYTIGAQTESRFLSFFTQILDPSSIKIEEAITNLHKIIYCPTLSNTKLENEIMAIKNELANFSYDYPNTNQVILHDNLFIGKDPMKDNEIISGNINNPAANLSIKDVKLFLEKYLKNPYQIIVTGGFNPDKIKLLIEKNFDIKSIQSKSKIIRKYLPKKTTTIFDSSKNSNITETYYGIGWATRNIINKEITALLIAFRAIADPDNKLYKELRNEHNLIYHFNSDNSYADNQLNLSLHTSFSGNNYKKITDIIMNFISTESLMKSAIENHLRLELSSSLSLIDGSKTTYSNQYFFSRFDLTIEEYLNHIKILSPDEIIEIFKRHINTNNATILVS